MAFHLPARRPRNNDPLRRRAGIQEAHCAVRPKEDSAGRGNRLSEERTRGTPSLYTSGRGGPDLDEALGLMQCMNCFFACFCGVLQLLRPRLITEKARAEAWGSAICFGPGFPGRM